jgi:hypothetical protein
MARKRPWEAGKLVRSLRAWAATPDHANMQRDTIQRIIDRDVDLNDHRTIVDASTALSHLGAVEGMLGVVKVMDDDPAGWAHLHASLLASVWYLALFARLHARGLLSLGHRDQNSAALAVAHAVALGQDDLAVWCGDLLVAGLEGNGPFRTWHLNPFEPFMTQLYGLWRSLEVHVERQGVHPLGVYGDVFMHLFPAEIIALGRIRQELRLPVAEVQHPLLATPLAKVPVPLPPLEQEYHLRLQTKTHAYLTGLRAGVGPSSP